ncbi:MAG: PP2C family protein-serine/threonine phosphatase [Vicinamibacterales bacterium]
MTQFDDHDSSRTTISFGPVPTDQPGAGGLGHYLVALEGAEPGRIVEITTEPVTIGRDATQTIVVPDAELSRRHARVFVVAGMVLAEDLKSTNGTFVDGSRITSPTPLNEGSLLRLGRQVFQYERRDRREAERSQQLSRDLQQASKYVLSLLPAPLDEGPVLTNWCYEPSALLGGDAFGYGWLDDDTFAFYLVDISGHGAGSAMHSVTILNVLRQRALPQVDFADPAAVLSSLNDRFQMESHDNLCFTMWYGIYRVSTRELVFSAAGHHPAFLVPPDRAAHVPLAAPHLMIGAVPGIAYELRRATLAPGSLVYLFSDGLFEIVTNEDRQWTLADFLPHLLPSAAEAGGTERLVQQVKSVVKDGVFDDDVSVLALTFR